MLQIDASRQHFNSFELIFSLLNAIKVDRHCEFAAREHKREAALVLRYQYFLCQFSSTFRTHGNTIGII